MQKNDQNSFKIEDEEKSIQNNIGWRAIIGGTLLHLSLGNCYMWGGISLYLASYLRTVDSRTTFSIMTNVYPICIIIINSCYGFGLSIAKRIGFKPMMTTMVSLIFIGVLSLSFVKDVYGFIAIYILFFCIPSGTLYLVPINIGWVCFPNNRGRVSGFIVAGYGLAAFIFNFVAKAIVNPDNLKPAISVVEDGTNVKYYSEEVSSNVPKMFQILSACWVVMGYVAITIIKVPKSLMKKDPSLKSTHIELNNNYNINPGPNMQFNERHTYANNLYFGWGGLMKTKSYHTIREITSGGRESEPATGKIEMHKLEENKDSPNKKHEEFVATLANNPITLKQKMSISLNPDKMEPFQDENHDEMDKHYENYNIHENIHDNIHEDKRVEKHCLTTPNNRSPDCETFWQGFLSFPFVFLCLIAVSHAYFGQFLLNQYKIYGMTQPALADDAYLTIVGSLASVGNGCSRTIWALLYDKIGFKKVYFTANILQLVITATIAKSTFSQPLYAIVVFSALFCMGCAYGTFGPQTTKMFGLKYGPVLYGIVCFFFGFSNIIAFILKLVNLDTDLCFWVAFGLTSFAFILACCIKNEYIWEVSKNHKDVHSGHPIAI